MIRHQARLAALHVTDHMPFYTCLRGQGLDFHHTLLRVILAEDAHARFDGCPDGFQRLCLGHHNKPDLPQIPPGTPRRVGNLIQHAQVILPDGYDGGVHGVIIIGQHGESLYEADQRPKAPGASLFGAMREPVARVTGGTEAGDLDLPHTGALQEMAVRLP